MRSLLITGANRGIGLEVVKQLLNHPTAKPEILIATARNPSEAKELQELAAKDKSLHILPLDVTQFDTLEAFGEKVSQIVGDRGLNVLINNAGVLLGNRTGDINSVTPDILTGHFVINTMAPIMITKTLLPLVKRAAAAAPSGGISAEKGAVIFMSAVMGSIKRNEGQFGGRCWGYRESKAALNTAMRTICKEVFSDGVGVLALHPGWVQTDMGGLNAPIGATESVNGVLNQVLGLSDANNGSFLQYDGTTLPW